MKTKEEIINTYAVNHGYESWRELIEDEYSIIGHLVHIDNVIDLIQDELKNKIANRFNGGFERCKIIETEIL